MKTFYRTTFTIDVLSEEPLGDCLSLSQIDYAISEGDCVGGNLQAAQTLLTGKGAALALIELGSDPGFFNLTEDGEPKDDE